MLESFILILLLGFFVGEIAQRFKAPALVGMVLVGIFIGPQVTDLISSEVTSSNLLLYERLL